LKLYWHDYKLRVSNSKNIKTEVLVCIARADTHLWYALKSTNNVWNVWNNDRGDIVNFWTLKQWIRAITNTLNNKYLWNKQTIGDLSFAGDCKIDCDRVYATSNDNRSNNTLNCLSLIYRQQIWPDFEFRLDK